MNMGMERWGFLFSVVSSPIVYFLKTTRAVCPNINPIMLCTHVCEVNYTACYCLLLIKETMLILTPTHVSIYKSRLDDALLLNRSARACSISTGH